MKNTIHLLIRRWVCKEKLTLEKLREEIMATFEDVQNDIADVKTAAEQSRDAATDAANAVERAIKILQAQPGGATQEQLDAARAELAAAKEAIGSSTVSSQGTKLAADTAAPAQP